MICHSRFLCFFLLATLLLGSACNLRQGIEDVQDIVIQPEIAAPLLNTRFTIDSLLTQLEADGSEVSAQGDGLIVVAFEDSIFSLDASTLLEMENLVTPIANTTTQIPLPVLGGTIREANVLTGTFSYDLQLGLPGSFVLTMDMPDAQLGGVALQVIDTLQGPGSVDVSLPIDGYDVLTPDGEFEFTYRLEQIGTGLLFEPQRFNIRFTDVIFTYLEGNFSNTALESGTNEEVIDLFGGFAGQDIQVENPVLTLTAYNSIGLPMAFEADPFAASNEAGQSENLDFAPLRDGFPLAFPSLNQQGLQMATDVSMNTSNSNIRDIASLLPNRFIFDWGVDIRNAQPGATYFLDQESKLDLVARLELPLNLRASNIIYEDTFAVQTELPDVEQLEAAEFKMITESRLPVSVNLQVYFLDENRAVIDSLLPNTGALLAAAPVDVDGQPAGTATEELFVPLDAGQYGRIGESRFIAYRLFIETTDQGSVPVKFVQEQDLQIKLGVRATLNAALPEDTGE